MSSLLSRLTLRYLCDTHGLGKCVDARAHTFGCRIMDCRGISGLRWMDEALQKGGAADWRTGAGTDAQTYFDESIDIHHIFPRAWCDREKLDPNIYNSILNKTPLSASTNRLLD